MNAPANFGIATGALIDERNDWDAALANIVANGWRVVELTAISEELFESLGRVLAQHSWILDSFDRVTIHAPVVFDTSVEHVVGKLATIVRPYDLILHPDVYSRQPAIARIGSRATFENMDIQKDFGRDVSDLQAVFEAWPDAGFCLDVAHVWTNDRSLALAHALIDTFGHRLRQLHVSGIEPDGTHRPTTHADLDLYSPVLARCPHVPWILEAELIG